VVISLQRGAYGPADATAIQPLPRLQLQQSIDISCPPSRCRYGSKGGCYGTDRRTDGRTDGLIPYRYIDPAAHYASSIRNRLTNRLQSLRWYVLVQRSPEASLFDVNTVQVNVDANVNVTVNSRFK